MTTRQRQVAIAAGPVFLGQGYKRTTMADIAMAAGLSRQGLYLAFPSKEAVFTAAVLVLTDALEARLSGALRQDEQLRSRLALVCDQWLGTMFDLQRSTPDARDMDDLAFPVVREVYRRFAALVVALIEEACGETLASAVTTDLGRSLVFAIRGFSATAVDGSDMRRLIALHIELVAGYVENVVAAHGDAGLGASYSRSPKRRGPAPERERISTWPSACPTDLPVKMLR